MLKCRNNPITNLCHSVLQSDKKICLQIKCLCILSDRLYYYYSN